MKSVTPLLKRLAKRVPGIAFLHRRVLALVPRRYIFRRIYVRNEWDGTDSLSGPGSDLTQTRAVIDLLPGILAERSIASMLDIPCGDFHWMRHVALGPVQYVGADIVEEIIAANRRRFETPSIQFRVLDVIKDELPAVDLVLCRDCLVHLSFKDITTALRNICDSGSTYLLATTFTRRTSNQDIVTGHWRRLNLEAVPFLLPQPVHLLNENCTEGAGENDDKSLGLWKITDIRERLKFRR